MTAISLRSVVKRFGDVTAVDHLDLDLREGELIAFLGPSGCGKTTTLRMIAGFEMPTDGQIRLGDEDVTYLPAEKRNCGMVFQNYALFPHLTVYRNVAFGLEMRRVPRGEVERRVASVLEKVQLRGLEGRYPRQLSGGQQQRTALARALVINPNVLLLDEPLANLDAKLREEMRFYIRTLQQEFGITTIYVTHDQGEALVLADRVAVMMGGVLQQIGTPEDLYRRPQTAKVADFVGLVNLLPVHVKERCAVAIRCESAVGSLEGHGPDVPDAAMEGWLSVRPENIRLSPSNGDGTTADGSGDRMNRLRGVVRDRAYLGSLIDYRIEVGAGLVLRVQGGAETSYRVGDAVIADFTDTDAWFVPKEEG